MTAFISEQDLRARAQEDLRRGLPVLLQNHNETALIIAAESLTPARFALLHDIIAMEPVFLALSAYRAQTLRIRVYEEGLVRVPITADTPIDLINMLADPARALDKPLQGPFQSLRGGQTNLSHAALALCKSARLLPAALIVTPKTPDMLIAQNITRISMETCTSFPAQAWQRVASTRIPLAVSEQTRLHLFRSPGFQEEHYAIEIGSPARHHPVLCRLHSECFTGDLLDSLKCDCGPQLRQAMIQIAAEGNGILLYLNQEGRGIGLANKLRAYSLQDQGFDTVEANHRLGFEDDERDFAAAAKILEIIGFNKIRLLTNNPRKVAALAQYGLEVTERIPLKTPHNPHNADYLAVKAAKSGHLL